MSESEFNNYNEVIYERDKLKEQNQKLKEALKVMVNLAAYGVDVCANNSRPEERSGHADGLRSMIDDANELLKSCE